MVTYADFLNSKPRRSMLHPYCQVINILKENGAYRLVYEGGMDDAPVSNRLITVYQGTYLLEGWYTHQFYFAPRHQSKLMVMYNVINNATGLVALRETENEFLDKYYEHNIYFQNEADAVWFNMWYTELKRRLAAGGEAFYV